MCVQCEIDLKTPGTSDMGVPGNVGVFFAHRRIDASSDSKVLGPHPNTTMATTPGAEPH